MAVDLTVMAVPFYFGSMAVEHRQLRRRAQAEGPSAADYDPPDTRASLAMGVASLVVPVASHLALRKLVPGRGRYGKVLVGTALGAAAVTTVADLLSGPDAHGDAAVPAEGAGARPGAGSTAWVDGAGAGPGAEAHASAPGAGARSGADQPSTGRARLARWARRTRRVTGPVAVGAGVLAAATWTSARTSATRMWEKGQRHDRGQGPLAWAAAIAGWDLVYYWNHRFMHEVRGMWAIHVVHHSSERYNLSTALRQPVADALGVWVPYGVLARVGIRPHLITQARAINLIYQFWIHTDVVRSIGVGEEVLNTPSHHRVHHGSNSRYIDRNHGSILILWDRLFGTFQREEEPVVYGLTKNIDTYNPVRIAGHEYVDIVRDVAGSTTWHDRLSYVLRGPGWAYARHAERTAASPPATAGVPVVEASAAG